MNTRSMSTVTGHDVVALDNAEQIGTVKHFVLSPDSTRIDRLHIDGRGSGSLFAEWSDLESFGPDRVVVKRASAPARSDDDHDIDSARGNLDVLGARILDTSGFEHGTVSDVDFDADTGRIVSIATSEADVIDAGRVHGIGSYAAVVDAGAD